MPQRKCLLKHAGSQISKLCLRPGVPVPIVVTERAGNDPGLCPNRLGPGAVLLR